MSRTLRYVLTIVLIIAAAIWLMTVYRSCQDQKTTDNTELTTDNNADDNSSESDEVDPLYTDEDTATDDAEDTTSDDDVASDDDIFEDEPEAEDSDDSEDDNTADNTESDVLSGSGEYLVVAGAFIAEHNAKRFQRNLTKNGVDSEIRIFIGSDYHSVIVGNFETERAAQKVADEIGGEAYVHKKRYPKKRRRS